MTNKSFDELMRGYRNNQLTEKELTQFIKLLQQEEYAILYKKSLDNSFKDDAISGLADQSKTDSIFRKIMETAGKEEAREVRGVHSGQRPKLFTWKRIAAAASVFGLIVVSQYLWMNNNVKQEIVKTEKSKELLKNDVLPGGDKAILTLADGSTIILDDTQNGNLTRQGNTKVIKLGGKLAYAPSKGEAQEIVYNTISTPKGGQYQIELPDGSEVWLNAASSLHFPTVFSGKERKVEITGEAYFEVVTNKTMPFIVSVNGSEVQVLGTHFNVMAYKDEKYLITTLLEGSVKFVSESSIHMLRPGQQSQLYKDGQAKVVSNVDVNDVLAWKNGMFHFENADIETVMRQVSRWYDVEVSYQNNNIKDLFVVEMPRSSKLHDVLKVLELTGNINFEMEGKRIIVKP